MLDSKILRSLWAALLLSTALMHTHAGAQSPPPDMPLPPCIEVDGQQQGACPTTSPDVTGEASGRFGAGATVTITTIPDHPICDSTTGYPPYPWAPSPCYSAVASPAGGLTCGVIDLQNGETFRELPCREALYKNPQDAPTPLISWSGRDGSSCGAAGNFQVYIYGGPANVPGARWSEFGPEELECIGTFNGPRPDGLRGPTWISISVGVDIAQNGDERRGSARRSAFYVPVDGDMRDIIDVDVLATSVLEGSDDNLTVTYTATLTNNGSRDAENVDVMITLPEHVHFLSASEDRCDAPASFAGGNVMCRGLTVAGKGHALGDDAIFIDVAGRIVNAADLDGLATVSATVPNDIDTSDNEDSTRIEVTLRAGSIADTRQAMEALAPYFDYETPSALLDQQCNVYMDDVFDRLQAIHAQAPEVFANVSYGKITSGDYYWAPIENRITRAGHVGVVVYAKGTNYHETGIVIHGTPTYSPSDLDLQSQVGVMAIGEHVNGLDHLGALIQQGTQGHGQYYRTPIQNFPGSPTPEGGVGCGFEGQYSDNQDEFRDGGLKTCRYEAPTCPYYPDAVIVRTESPVDILASNAQGQRVETRGGQISLQELGSGIHSFATPHEDGTFGWTLVLPRDDYDIDLLGTGEGPYRLTLTTFDASGEPVDTVFEGTTQSGQVDNYELAGAPPQPPDNDDGGAGSGGNGDGSGVGSGNSGGGVNRRGGGGGGSFGLFSLLALLPLACWCVGALPRARRKATH